MIQAVYDILESGSIWCSGLYHKEIHRLQAAGLNGRYMISNTALVFSLDP